MIGTDSGRHSPQSSVLSRQSSVLSPQSSAFQSPEYAGGLQVSSPEDFSDFPRFPERLNWSNEKKASAFAEAFYDKTNFTVDRAANLPQPPTPRPLLYLGEDNDERIQRQGLNQRQAQNQRQLNSRTGRGVPCQSLGSGGRSFRLRKAADCGCDCHGEPGGNCDPIRLGCCAALRKCRNREAHGRQRHEQVAQFT